MANLEEFEQFMRQHQNMVYSIAVRMLANEAEAADITQEVFLKAYDHFTTVVTNPSAPGWLRTVTTNLSLNYLTRYRNRWRFFSEMSSGDHGVGMEEILPEGRDRSEEEDREYRRHHLEQALRRLPEAQRVPLVLYHFEEISYEEIAQRLGISLSKVKTDIHRGRESLRRWLRPNPDEWAQREQHRGGAGSQRPEGETNALAWPHGWPRGWNVGVPDWGF